MLFALDICVNKKAHPTHSVHWGLTPLLKNVAPSFLPSPLLNLQTIQATFLGDSPPKIAFFMHLPRNRIFH